jgi:hypothetical protein
LDALDFLDAKRGYADTFTEQQKLSPLTQLETLLKGGEDTRESSDEAAVINTCSPTRGSNKKKPVNQKKEAKMTLEDHKKFLEEVEAQVIKKRRNIKK